MNRRKFLNNAIMAVPIITGGAFFLRKDNKEKYVSQENKRSVLVHIEATPYWKTINFEDIKHQSIFMLFERISPNRWSPVLNKYGGVEHYSLSDAYLNNGIYTVDVLNEFPEITRPYLVSIETKKDYTEILNLENNKLI